MIVCNDADGTYTYVTLELMRNLGKLKNLYRKTVQKVSKQFDVPVKNVKSCTTAKVYVLHRTNQQAL